MTTLVNIEAEPKAHVIQDDQEAIERRGGAKDRQLSASKPLLLRHLHAENYLSSLKNRQLFMMQEQIYEHRQPSIGAKSLEKAAL